MFRIWFEVPGSLHAPEFARRRVLSGLGQTLTSTSSDDVALLVSELVTNSVRYANVGAGMIDVEVTLSLGLLRLAVTDPGGETLPRIIHPDGEHPGGLGLLFVDALSSSWGVEQDTHGPVEVWCEIQVEDRKNHDGSL